MNVSYNSESVYRKPSNEVLYPLNTIEGINNGDFGNWIIP